MPDPATPWSTEACRLRLGNIEIDLRYRIVRRENAAVELNPRCFDLLLLFLREPGVLHTREAIFRKVWPGVVVEEASLTSCIWQLRRAFGEVAKHWIRTVTKQGYVFDPPPAIRIVALDTPTPLVEGLATPLVAVADSADAMPDTADALPLDAAFTTPRAAARRWRVRPLVAAALLLAVAGFGYAALQGSGTSRAPQRVVLIAADTAATAESARWPVVLLQAWIDWQLRSAPGTAVVGATETCANCTELTIVLGAEMSARNDGLWQLSVRYRGEGRHADIARTSTTTDLVAALDGISGEVVRAVAPSLGDAVPIALDAASAEQLARGFRHEQQHRWSDAARAFGAVVEKVPRFGYARLRLASALNQIGQQGAARAQIKYANAWIDALPEALRAPLDAQRLLITHDYDKAAVAFAALGQRNGGDAAYRPDEAFCLMRLGRERDAAQKLAGDVPAQPAVAVRWLLQLADAQIANYAAPQAMETAQAAVDLAARFGWEHERARAELLLAQARYRKDPSADAALLDDAMRRFEASGDRLGTLRTHYFAELIAAGRDPAAAPRADELLAEARLAGNPAVEIETLLQTRQFYKSTGDVPRMREQLAQAAALAESVGTPYERRTIEQLLVVDDVLRLDFATADRRIAVLRKAPLQGAATFNLGYNIATIAYLRGQYDAALATMDAAENTLKTTESLPQIARAVSCVRILSHLVQGQTPAARNDIQECRDAGLYSSPFSDLASAELAIQTGDLAEARRLLAPLPRLLAGVEDQNNEWPNAISTASLLARVGEFDAARDIVDRLLPRLTAVRYNILVVEAHITRAEIALAQNRPDDAERDLAAVAPLIPADVWYFQRRLRTLGALIARTRGDADGAAHELDTLHGDAVALHDVLTELQVHSLMSRAQLDDRCSERRHQQLIADSGLRGTSDRWLTPDDVHGDRQVLVKATSDQ
jgi:DNA-binding winged helix-turn-helix (wHTH) protein